MTTKARHCDECEWFARNEIEHVCRKQHNPRFYQPTSEGDLSWGWKRRCEDSKERENGLPARHP